MSKQKISFRSIVAPDGEPDIWMAKNGRAVSKGAAKHALLKNWPSACRFVLQRTDHTTRLAIFYGPLQEGAQPEIEERKRRWYD